MKEKIFTRGWEKRLETQFLHPQNERTAYVCSPLKASDTAGFLRNMHSAREYMYYAQAAMKLFARAPHAYLPLLLCDAVETERQLALRFGLRLLKHSNLMLVCGDKISEGMKGEISLASRIGLPIYVFGTKLFAEVRRLVGNSSVEVALIGDHPAMASASPKQYLEKNRERRKTVNVMSV